MRGQLMVEVTIWRLEDEGTPPTKILVHQGSAVDKGGWATDDPSTYLVDGPSRKKLFGFTFEPIVGTTLEPLPASLLKGPK
jgi:hypothetical protein